MPTLPPNAMSAQEVLDAYFLETRCKLIEIAATLDRMDRAPRRERSQDDPRVAFIAQALAILASDAPHRAERIQRLYSTS